jgi:hypothetical protein
MTAKKKRRLTTNPAGVPQRIPDVTHTGGTEHRAAAVTAASLAGVLSAAVALGVAEPIAALVRPEAAPLVAVGSAAIDLTPQWLKGAAVRAFGTHDKAVLLTGMGAAVTLLAAMAGLAARRDRRWGVVALMAAGSVGMAAALGRPGGGPLDALPSLTGSGAGAADRHGHAGLPTGGRRRP